MTIMMAKVYIHSLIDLSQSTLFTEMCDSLDVELLEIKKVGWVMKLQTYYDL